MHRHGYQGRKFGRERDQRRALIKGLADSLILHESIETTLEKAKTLRPYTEKLITKAKKGGLANRRAIISGLNTKEAANKLVDELAPKIGRESGYLRIERTITRRGDNAQLARISFVDDFASAPVAKSAKSTKAEKAADAKSATTTDKKADKKPATSKAAKSTAKKPAAKKASKTTTKKGAK